MGQKLFAQHAGSRHRITLICSNDSIQIDDESESRVGKGVQMKIDDLCPERANDVLVSLERSVDQDVSRARAETAAIPGLVANAANDQRDISAKMMMASEDPCGLVESYPLGGKDKLHQCRSRSGGTASAVTIATT